MFHENLGRLQHRTKQIFVVWANFHQLYRILLGIPAISYYEGFPDLRDVDRLLGGGEDSGDADRAQLVIEVVRLEARGRARARLSSISW